RSSTSSTPSPTCANTPAGCGWSARGAAGWRSRRWAPSQAPRERLEMKLLTSPAGRDYLGFTMTHRNIHPQTLHAADRGGPVALASAVILVVLLITVLHGAGVGFA